MQNLCCLTGTTDVVTMAGMTLGQNLKALREQKGISQEALAARAGLGENGQQIVAAIEKRQSKSSRYAPALAVALGIPLEELLGSLAVGENQPLRPVSQSSTPTKDQLGEWNWLFMRMLPEFRETLLEAAREAAELSEEQKQQGAV